MPVTGTPYRSKMVSFAVERMQYWQRRCQKAMRWAKVGIIGGVQWLLHPVYLLARANRWAGHTLHSSRANLKLLGRGRADTRAAAAVDKSLAHILKIARIHVLPEVLVLTPTQSASTSLSDSSTPAATALTTIPTSNTDLAPGSKHSTLSMRRQAIRGLACQVDYRGLVLVDNRNLVLDCLSAAQQKFLLHQIDRALQKANGSVRSGWALPSPLQLLQRARVFALPARRSSQLAAATPTSLSTSATHSVTTGSRLSLPQRTWQHLQRWLPISTETSALPEINPFSALVRAAIAYFSSKQAATQLPGQTSSPQLSEIPATPQLTARIDNTTQTVAAGKRLSLHQRTWQNLQRWLPIPLETSALPETNPFFALLKAAIAYFSSKQAATQLPGQTSSSQLPAIPPNPRLTTRVEVELPAPHRIKRYKLSAGMALPESLPSLHGRSAFFKHLTPKPNQLSVRPKDGEPPIKQAPHLPFAVIPQADDISTPERSPQSTSAAIAPRSQATPSLTLQQTPKQARIDVSASQPIIDTEAATIGYDKHWHQQVLEKVDRAAYGVENAAEQAGDRAQEVSQHVWHHLERGWQGISDRSWTDKLLTVTWDVLMLTGALVATFVEVILPVLGRLVLQGLRWLAIGGWMLFRIALVLLGGSIQYVWTYLESRM
ncbi:MAG: hypothetical protein AAGB13_03965 [Cyanobacteria bacterium P01_F01_bin.33]